MLDYITVTDFRRNVHLPSNSRFLLPRSTLHPLNLRRTVFLDRDGVLIQDVGYLKNFSDTKILPNVSEALNILQTQFYIVVVTNQSAVGRGIITSNELKLVHHAICNNLSNQGAIIDALYYCPHSPCSIIFPPCDCRKPKPGMLLKAEMDWNLSLSESYLFGDKFSDIKAGLSVGVKSFLVDKDSDEVDSGYKRFPDLLHGAEWILSRDK